MRKKIMLTRKIWLEITAEGKMLRHCICEVIHVLWPVYTVVEKMTESVSQKPAFFFEICLLY